MRIQEEIQNRREDFSRLCQSHHISRLYAFGSSTGESFQENCSDIDLLVEIETMNPIERGESLISLWDELEKFFKRKVDLLTASSIRNPVLRQRIESTKILLYDGRGSKVLV